MIDEMERLLKERYGANAAFREGQQEAILRVISGQRVLAVQRTGWGKSIIYFIATKILRRRGYGLCLIISPLLALMKNQIEAAETWGLQAKTINSNNYDEWDEIEIALSQNLVDVLFISPERLSNPDFYSKILPNMQQHIGMLVIDEAHCISDWGHDFRPDYMRIINIVKNLPPNVPLLATTATANNRVVEDIEQQLGGKVTILRGSLARESLHIQIISVNSISAKMAWLAQHLNELPGTGIIYCLTVNDCRNVDKWLRKCGISTAAYYANKSKEEKEEMEEAFYSNKIKALVATVALGMGIDKPDIGFVIHFQKPGNIIAYYQQIGRAGRSLNKAYAILLAGKEDDIINNFFINTAFPTDKELNKVVRVIENHTEIKLSQITEELNMSDGRIKNALKFLEIHGDIYKFGSYYLKSPKKWIPNLTKATEITQMRRRELQQMNQLVTYTGCYMEFVTNALDDSTSHPCGKCGNCNPQGKISEDIRKETVEAVQKFLQKEVFEITPRKQFPNRTNIPIKERLQAGIVLSNYADEGWGKLVKQNKYIDGKFSDELVDAAYKKMRQKCIEWDIDAITAVPSKRRPNLVPDFAKRLADRLQIPFKEFIQKISDVEEQKQQNNSSHQYKNANDSLETIGSPSGNILLIDDMVDSGWTLTVCASKLVRAGAEKVYSFVLANTGGKL